jgi:hypothetical protein
MANTYTPEQLTNMSEEEFYTYGGTLSDEEYFEVLKKVTGVKYKEYVNGLSRDQYNAFMLSMTNEEEELHYAKEDEWWQAEIAKAKALRDATPAPQSAFSDLIARYDKSLSDNQSDESQHSLPSHTPIKVNKSITITPSKPVEKPVAKPSAEEPKEKDWKFEFNPEGFFGALKKDNPSDDKYLKMTFEDYLKKNQVWNIYKNKLNDTTDYRLNQWRKDYNEEIKNRYNEVCFTGFLSHPLNDILGSLSGNRHHNNSNDDDDEDSYAAEQRRLQHISEFGH